MSSGLLMTTYGCAWSVDALWLPHLQLAALCLWGEVATLWFQVSQVHTCMKRACCLLVYA